MDSNIIIIFSILLFVISLIFTEIKFKSIFELNILYSLLWIIVIIASKYNNLGLIRPRDNIYLIIFLSMLLINLMYLFLPFKNKNIIDYSRYKINEKRILVLNIIAYILFLPSIISAFKLLITNGFDLVLVRNTVYVGITESENAAIYSIIFRTIPTAIFTFIELISSYYLIQNKNKKIIIIGLFDMILGTLIYGGRNFILYFALFCFFHYLNIPNKNRIKIKKRYFLYLILLLFFITKNRDVNKISFIQTIILYYAGSLSFLEVIMRQPVTYGLNVHHYGLLSFGFITEPIILVLKTFFKFNIKVPSYYFNIYAQRFVNIGESIFILYNNNTTFLYPFALDFGINYLLLGTIIYFSIILFTLSKKNKGNLSYYFIYIYISSTLLNSSVSYGLIGLSSSLIILLTFLTIKKMPNGGENK